MPVPSREPALTTAERHAIVLTLVECGMSLAEVGQILGVTSGRASQTLRAARYASGLDGWEHRAARARLTSQERRKRLDALRDMLHRSGWSDDDVARLTSLPPALADRLRAREKDRGRYASEPEYREQAKARQRARYADDPDYRARKQMLDRLAHERRVRRIDERRRLTPHEVDMIRAAAAARAAAEATRSERERSRAARSTAREVARARVEDTIRELRETGLSWREIGIAIGTSKQYAQQVGARLGLAKRSLAAAPEPKGSPAD